MFTFNFFIAPLLLIRNERSLAKSIDALRNLGSDFWKGSNKRGARRFGTGMGGYSNLADHVKRHLGI